MIFEFLVLFLVPVTIFSLIEGFLIFHILTRSFWTALWFLVSRGRFQKLVTWFDSERPSPTTACDVISFVVRIPSFLVTWFIKGHRQLAWSYTRVISSPLPRGLQVCDVDNFYFIVWGGVMVNYHWLLITSYLCWSWSLRGSGKGGHSCPRVYY